MLTKGLDKERVATHTNKPTRSVGRARLPRTKSEFLMWELSQPWSLAEPNRYEFIKAPVAFDEPSEIRDDLAHRLKSLLSKELCDMYRQIREPYMRLDLGAYIFRPDLVVTDEDVRRDPCGSPMAIFLIEGSNPTKPERVSAMRRHLSIEGLCSIVTLREDKVAASILTVWGSEVPKVEEIGPNGHLCLPKIQADIPLSDVYENIIAA